MMARDEQGALYVDVLTKKRFCAAAMARGMSENYLLQECLKMLASEESQAVRKSYEYYLHLAGID